MSPYLSSGLSPVLPGAPCFPSTHLPEPLPSTVSSFCSCPRPPPPTPPFRRPSGRLDPALSWASSLASSLLCRVSFLTGLWARLRAGEFISLCPQYGAQWSVKVPCSNAGQWLLGHDWVSSSAGFQGPRNRPATCPSGSFTSLGFSRR